MKIIFGVGSICYCQDRIQNSSALGILMIITSKFKLVLEFLIASGPSMFDCLQVPCTWTETESCYLGAVLFLVSGDMSPYFVGKVLGKTKCLPPVSIGDFGEDFDLATFAAATATIFCRVFFQCSPFLSLRLLLFLDYFWRYCVIVIDWWIEMTCWICRYMKCEGCVLVKMCWISCEFSLSKC